MQHKGGTAPVDTFWANVDECVDAITTARTVEEVISILNRHFEPSSGAAFFGGSGGDRQLMSALREAGWAIVWAEAVYYFVAKDPAGDLLTYIEGDVYRGDAR
ncbi:hypothetical protein H7I87_00400 [Mycobacterium timonense]|uniref:Uncharacterized protein n=2 Tax=Mycobacterium avium complex (MAC) TaxID=120793 RepID=A0AAW5RZW8_MYCBC|nr:hypothetical protein [Mycobacterium bouchedurhonense]MCV6993227.1 hypothetical protein [Mycobacterium timonense]MDV3306411.1 hypothetical protein [Mycobacterium avium subsp. hominissuis]ORA45529.1 hypothetical protein BST19_20135 [Mycobacterium bouchedurhonense]ORB76705.1 hypothetical protein BST46_28615 [Mycobacterium timonense]